jgi:hypothetical protein
VILSVSGHLLLVRDGGLVQVRPARFLPVLGRELVYDTFECLLFSSACLEDGEAYQCAEAVVALEVVAPHFTSRDFDDFVIVPQPYVVPI